MLAELASSLMASPLGPQYHRFHACFKWGPSKRYVWSVEGPEGALVFQAGPSGIPASLVLEHDLKMFPMVNGIPWIGWDLGGHHHEQKADYYRYNEECPAFRGNPCWFDSGTALGAERLLVDWIEHDLDDEWLFEELEKTYPGWMGT